MIEDSLIIVNTISWQFYIIKMQFDAEFSLLEETSLEDM